MRNKSISPYVQQNWKKVAFITMMLVSVPLMIIPIIKGFFSGFHYLMLLGGVIFFLLIFELKGDDIFNIRLLSYLGEDIAFGVGFFLLAGIIASIVGIALGKKSIS